MATFNGISVVRRYNRPSPNSKAYLELYTLENGQYTDIYQVCSVHVFKKLDYDSTTKTIHYFQSSSTGLIEASSVSGEVAMVFSGISTETVDSTIGVYDSTAFADDAQSASSVFKVNGTTGRYAVVLKEGAAFMNPQGFSAPVAEVNEASSVSTYFDVWTIKTTASSPAQLFIDEFDLHDSSYLHFTEPLQIKVKNHLKTNRVHFGGTENLLINTNISILNRSIDKEVKSTVRHSLLDSAQFKILRYNEDSANPNFQIIKDWADVTHLDGADTISISFPTSTWIDVVKDNLDNRRGVYHVQVKYTMLDQVIYSEEFPFSVA